MYLIEWRSRDGVCLNEADKSAIGHEESDEGVDEGKAGPHLTPTGCAAALPEEEFLRIQVRTDAHCVRTIRSVRLQLGPSIR
jgi:hypothetical protein